MGTGQSPAAPGTHAARLSLSKGPSANQEERWATTKYNLSVGVWGAALPSQMPASPDPAEGHTRQGHR